MLWGTPWIAYLKGPRWMRRQIAAVGTLSNTKSPVLKCDVAQSHGGQFVSTGGSGRAWGEYDGDANAASVAGEACGEYGGDAVTASATGEA